MSNNLKPNANFRRDKIPLWINISLTFVIVVLAFQAFAGYFMPQLLGENMTNETLLAKRLMMMLASRNAVFALLSLSAIGSQNAMFLAYAFMGNLLWALQDMFLTPYFMNWNTTGFGASLVFLILFVLPFILAIRKLRTLAELPD
ncbi:MAG: hypothetical protein NTW54_10000 [Bacteroidetes bacterium]|nr:hypothetical protein [Bacteroidota bacterium]